MLERLFSRKDIPYRTTVDTILVSKLYTSLIFPKLYQFIFHYDAFYSKKKNNDTGPGSSPDHILYLVVMLLVSFNLEKFYSLSFMTLSFLGVLANYFM